MEGRSISWTQTVPTGGPHAGRRARPDVDLVFATFLAPDLMPIYQAITDAVGRGLGLTTELIVEEDYESCLDDLHDVCFVCSLPYVMFEREGISPAEPIAAPVLFGERYQGLPIYFSDVIVHSDSPFRSFADLRHGSWAYNEPWSQSGYGLMRHHLLSLGETSGFFGRVVQSGFHEKSIRMVTHGEVDSASIDSHVLEIEMRNDPMLRGQLRVIEMLGPSTIQPVAVSKRLSPELRSSILDVLLDMHHDPMTQPALEQGLIDHFAPVDAGSYDDIRAMVDAAEAAGFIEIS